MPYDDDGAPTISVISSTYQRARKEHKCDTCGGVIAKGKLYARQVFTEDGKLTTIKSHYRGGECAEMMLLVDENLQPLGYSEEDGDMQAWW